MSDDTKWALGLVGILFIALFTSMIKHYVECSRRWVTLMEIVGSIRARQEDYGARIQRLELSSDTRGHNEANR